MRVVYSGPIDAVEIPEANCIAVRDEAFDVDDELGARLIEQRPFDTSPDQVLAWVGKDPDRARRLLLAERDGAARPELLAQLEQIASPPKPAPPAATPAPRKPAAAEKGVE